MAEKVVAQFANAVENGDFIYVVTHSGRGRTAMDPGGGRHFLPFDASDRVLGGAVLHALAGSRVMSLEEAGEFLDFRSLKERYEDWVSASMARYGYQSRRALFRNMKSCDIQRVGSSITMSPTRHEKLEGWGREKGDEIEDVVIPSDSDPAEIGRSLRLAFSRCR